MVRPADAVIISSNENPLGPAKAALEAIAATSALGGPLPPRDQRRDRQGLQRVLRPQAQATSVSSPGSGTPLDYAFYSNVGPDKPVVVAGPSYLQGANAGKKMGAQVFTVPLKADGSHDVKAMVAATPNAGAYYIVNPNNPTGTMTPQGDIVWLLENKPAGSVVIVDEGLSSTSRTTSRRSISSPPIRTSSSCGPSPRSTAWLASAPASSSRSRSTRPSSARCQPAPSPTAAVSSPSPPPQPQTASLQDKTLIATRRKINADIRADVLEWMDKNGYEYYKGSQANFFQANVKRPGPEFAKLMQQDHVYIGRTWVEMPNYVRVNRRNSRGDGEVQGVLQEGVRDSSRGGSQQPAVP